MLNTNYNYSTEKVENSNLYAAIRFSVLEHRSFMYIISEFDMNCENIISFYIQGLGSLLFPSTSYFSQVAIKLSRVGY